MIEIADVADLPGGALVLQGIDDAGRGRDTMEARLVLIAATRLRRLGLPVPRRPSSSDPDLDLYELLCRVREIDDPYDRYNAMRRELSSFLEALERRARRPSSVTAIAPATARRP